MFRNYLITAFRSLIRQKGFSFINILGLAIGLAAALLILLWVQDELSFDKFHEHADRLYRVEEDQYYSGEVYHVNVTPYPSGPVWKDEIPEIEDACRYQWPSGMLFTYGEKAFYEGGCVAVDSTFFNLFTYDFLHGNKATALTQPYSAVLTEEAAEKYFGDENPVGKSFTANSQFEFTVTAVLKSLPKNSINQFDILVPFDFLKETGQYDDRWGSNSIRTYIKLYKNALIDSVDSKLTAIVKQHNEENTTDFMAAPFTGVHLHQYWGYGNDPGAIVFVYIFSAIAIFVLLIACINFMNLSTAKSSTRAREIGLRKASGASKRAIIIQFFGESVLLAFISLIFALIIVSSILKVFNIVSGKELDFSSLVTPQFIIAMILVTLIAGLISGIYPALYLSAFRPIKVLKGDLSSGMKSGWFRKVLVIVQFTLSVFLIIGTVIIYRQLNYMKSKDLGYDRENMFYFQMRGQIKDNYQTIKDEFLRDPQVLGVSAASHQPHQIGSNSDGGDWDGRDPDMDVLIGNNIVDYDFTETMKIELKDGRSFSIEFPGDMASMEDTSANFMINEVLEEIMEKENAVGERFQMWGMQGRIVGVMKDFHYHSVRTKIEPLIFMLGFEEYLSWIVVRVAPGDLTKTMKDLEKTWTEIMPGYPFDYSFVDESIDQMYRTEERLGTLLKYFTILAIIIACLGLFGLASFTAEQRTQEIGVRKVMGARVSTVMMLLSKEFSVLVIISCLIAIPASLLVMGKVFLQNFEYRTDMAWWIFLAASMAALLIAVLTVSYQAARAALTNPADALRYE
jgi:putative ABC transport system permease protein